ncbi:3-keto-disaccharide hydrolase [Planctomicrobium sp. SH661]|uniref:3-keto-disaccharide hydrolase n=1 Tax=Planctomicrobium sp. SH661 TaxID=3448124 RepID=UPI003F5B8538
MSVSRNQIHYLSVALALAATSLPVQAQNNSKPTPPPAYLNADEAGPDYELQGEYRGWQRSLGSDRSSRSVGLQVVALGDGNFVASKYYGGLPGAGWSGKQRFEYTGKSVGDIVRLFGSDYRIEVDGKTAAIFSKEGSRSGDLQKVERVSPTMGAIPPQGAIILFSGGPTEQFVNPKITKDGLLREGTQTSQAFGDMRLHAEFQLPFKPKGRGQDRGNSGFYLQGRYEVQVLDSFGRAGIENECGSIYRTKRPDVNMCFPPLAWQTYDIDFTMPKFDSAGQKVSDMQITIWQNGVLVHDHALIPNKTGGGIAEGPQPLPTKLQDHSNPVQYRNIWLIPKTPDTMGSNNWVHLPLSGPPTPLNSYAMRGVLSVDPSVSDSIGGRCP